MKKDRKIKRWSQSRVAEKERIIRKRKERVDKFRDKKEEEDRREREREKKEENRKTEEDEKRQETEKNRIFNGKNLIITSSRMS